MQKEYCSKHKKKNLACINTAKRKINGYLVTNKSRMFSKTNGSVKN